MYTAEYVASFSVRSVGVTPVFTFIPAVDVTSRGYREAQGGRNLTPEFLEI